MQYPEFLQRVQEQISASEPATQTQRAAEQAITATLQTLSERLTGGEVNDLAAQLPEELKAPLQRSAEEAERFSLEALTDYKKFPDRAHYTVGQDGWDEVAD